MKSTVTHTNDWVVADIALGSELSTEPNDRRTIKMSADVAIELGRALLDGGHALQARQSKREDQGNASREGELHHEPWSPIDLRATAREKVKQLLAQGWQSLDDMLDAIEEAYLGKSD